DYNGPVVARQFRPAVMEMHRHWTEILDVLPAGDLLHLAKMPEFLSGQKNPLMSLAGVHRMKLASYGVALGPDWERWPAEAIEPKLLKEITARTRKLEKRGHVTFAVVQNPIEAQPVFEAMLEQRSQRHAQMQRPNILARPGYIDFYRSQFQNAHGDAPAAIASLAIDGELIATGYGLTGNGAFHMIFPTFKADRWRNYSPGLQLITRTMRWAAGRDYSFFDFTIGGESFKRDLGACERPLFEKYVALSPRGIPVIMASRVKRAVRQSPSMAQWAITALGLQNSGGL
ncbi:MAG: GNAT family N-acetyltransferase, partial [Hyphomicrobium sp.]